MNGDMEDVAAPEVEPVDEADVAMAVGEQNLHDAPEVDEAEIPGRVDLAELDESVEIDPALFEARPDMPVFTEQVRTTALHFSVARESRTNLWQEWNGFTVADVLTDIETEYFALRHRAALIDVSPLVKYRISGREAGPYLERLVAGNARELSLGDVAPVVFCEDRGFVVGDGLLFRIGEEEYRLVTEEPHLAWLRDSAFGFSVRVEEVTTTVAALSLQGPASAGLLHDVGFAGIETLRPFAARWFELRGMPVYVSRTGCSGDLGYELWIDPEDAPLLWARIVETGEGQGLRVGGLALRELGRIEAGQPRSGRDYLGAFAAPDIDSASTPFELGLAPLVDLEAGHFTGRDALRRAREGAPRHMLVSVLVDCDTPLTFSALRQGDAIAGLVTSAAFSPSLAKTVAFAVVPPEAIDRKVPFHVEANLREGLRLKPLRAAARIVAGPVLPLPARHLVPAPLDPVSLFAEQDFARATE